MNVQIIIIYFLTKLIIKRIPSSTVMQRFTHQRAAAEHMWDFSDENNESQIMWLQPKISKEKTLDPYNLLMSIDSLTKELSIHYKILPIKLSNKRMHAKAPLGTRQWRFQFA